MSAHRSLSDGTIHFRISAEDRRLLDEIIGEGRRRPQARSVGFTDADVMLPLMQKWTKSPRTVRAPIDGKGEAWVDGTAKFHRLGICEAFVRMLAIRREQNASAVLRGLLYEYLAPRKAELQKLAAQSAAEQEKAARNAAEAAYMRRLRKALRKSVADGIEVFLAELSAQYGAKYKGRSLQRMERDAAALVKLGERVAKDLATITDGIARRDSRARGATHLFADRFVAQLGFKLVRPFRDTVWGRSGLSPKFGEPQTVNPKPIRFS